MSKKVTLLFNEEIAAFFGIDTAFECVVPTKNSSSDFAACCECLSGVMEKNVNYIASVILVEATSTKSLYQIWGKFTILEKANSKKINNLILKVAAAKIEQLGTSRPTSKSAR